MTQQYATRLKMTKTKRYETMYAFFSGDIEIPGKESGRKVRSKYFPTPTISKIKKLLFRPDEITIYEDTLFDDQPHSLTFTAHDDEGLWNNQVEVITSTAGEVKGAS